MSRTKKSLLSDDHAAALADLFHVLGDPTRLRIVVSCLRAPLAVSDHRRPAGPFGVAGEPPPAPVEGARAWCGLTGQGKQVFYEADDAHVRRMVEDMVTHIGEH